MSDIFLRIPIYVLAVLRVRLFSAAIFCGHFFNRKIVKNTYSTLFDKQKKIVENSQNKHGKKGLDYKIYKNGCFKSDKLHKKKRM